MNQSIRRASASAPASIGNIGVGFDALGLAFDAVRDHVSVFRESEPGIRLGSVSGLVHTLPDEVGGNCALAAANAVLEAAGAPCGIRLDIEKGVPLSAGMGGSAASAVAAAGATNALLGEPFKLEDLLPLAMEGERVSADPPPWDNVMSALLGGMVLAARLDPPLIRRLPVPSGVACVLIHPARHVETQAARDLLAPHVQRETAVEHARNVAAFVAGCAADDLDLVRSGLKDILIEPQRLPLLPELSAVKQAAETAGALGCSFSGSGPSVFAWARDEDRERVEAAMLNAFRSAGCDATAYKADIDSSGLRVEAVE